MSDCCFQYSSNEMCFLLSDMYRIVSGQELKMEKKPAKNYFVDKTIEGIITNFPFKSGLSAEAIAQEKSERKSLINFVEGLLRAEPEDRWTPAQAMQHPFIQQKEFTGTFIPPARVRQRAHTVAVDRFDRMAFGAQAPPYGTPPAGLAFGTPPSTRFMMLGSPHHTMLERFAPPGAVGYGTSPSTRLYVHLAAASQQQQPPMLSTVPSALTMQMQMQMQVPPMSQIPQQQSQHDQAAGFGQVHPQPRRQPKVLLQGTGQQQQQQQYGQKPSRRRHKRSNARQQQQQQQQAQQQAQQQFAQMQYHSHLAAQQLQYQLQSQPFFFSDDNLLDGSAASSPLPSPRSENITPPLSTEQESPVDDVDDTDSSVTPVPMASSQRPHALPLAIPQRGSQPPHYSSGSGGGSGSLHPMGRSRAQPVHIPPRGQPMPATHLPSSYPPRALYGSPQYAPELMFGTSPYYAAAPGFPMSAPGFVQDIPGYPLTSPRQFFAPSGLPLHAQPPQQQMQQTLPSQQQQQQQQQQPYDPSSVPRQRWQRRQPSSAFENPRSRTS
eukprot:TRINITY_DN728_c0_g2_i1.p1 TRINITY_DN728_c0_g2~~TRINITY_DN728_c0_g2_i1.p1  ORF type:complete len:549 (+),score=156.22 TRINITY_DN728_c0_g2_i1:1188-2834(+)